MPEYSFVLAGRVGVGKSSLFAYVKNGMSPADFSGDLSPGRRHEDYGLETLTYETQVNGRDTNVSKKKRLKKNNNLFCSYGYGCALIFLPRLLAAGYTVGHGRIGEIRLHDCQLLQERPCRHTRL